MNEDAKRTALRMIPYGMYILTTKSQDGQDVGAATVNWLTQTSFAPPWWPWGSRPTPAATSTSGIPAYLR